MTEALRAHTPINMCEEDLEALQRLKTIFARAAWTNSDVQIKSNADIDASKVANDNAQPRH